MDGTKLSALQIGNSPEHVKVAMERLIKHAKKGSSQDTLLRKQSLSRQYFAAWFVILQVSKQPPSNRFSPKGFKAWVVKEFALGEEYNIRTTFDKLLQEIDRVGEKVSELPDEGLTLTKCANELKRLN